MNTGKTRFSMLGKLRPGKKDSESVPASPVTPQPAATPAATSVAPKNESVSTAPSASVSEVTPVVTEAASRASSSSSLVSPTTPLAQSPEATSPTTPSASLPELTNAFRVSDGVDPPPTFWANKRGSTLASIGRLPSHNNKTLPSPDDGINPTEVLIHRLDAWKGIIKLLISYFEEVADVESKSAKNYQKVSAIIQLPLKETGNHWQEKNGIQALYETFRDGARNVGADHEEFSQFCIGTIIPSLQKIKKEIKDRIATLQKDDNLSTDHLFKEVEHTKKAVAALDKMCQLASVNPQAITEKHDPWISNILVTIQIKKQVKEENRLHEATLALQQQIKAFEGGIIEEIKTTVHTFYEWRSKDLSNYKQMASVVATVLEHLHPDTEWNGFIELHKNLLVSQNARLKEPDDISYPNKDNPLIATVKQGRMERKTGVLKNFSDRYYVLTPVGFLHEFKSLDDVTDPEVSLFLPGSAVALPTDKDVKKNPYGLEIRGKNTAGLIKNEKNFVFKANSHEEQQEWFSKLKEVCSRAAPAPASETAGVTPIDTTEAKAESSVPSSPVVSRESANTHPAEAAKVEPEQKPVSIHEEQSISPDSAAADSAAADSAAISAAESATTE